MSYCAQFMMRIRGKKTDCETCLSLLNIIDQEIDEQHGTEADSMFYLHGRCQYSLQYSMVEHTEHPLAALAKNLTLELEAFSYDEEDPVGVQHYHYKGNQCIKAFSLPSYLEIDEEYRDSFLENSPDAQYYDWNEDNEWFELKPEFEEYYRWHEDEWRMEVHFTMSFDDLKGK